MVEEQDKQNFSEEIFTIPEEFYGAQKKAVVARAPSVALGSAPLVLSSSASSVQSNVKKNAPVKSNQAFFSSKKIIILAIIFFLLVITGFSYYYFNQAQKARQRFIDSQKPAEQPVVIQPEQPVVIVEPPVVETEEPEIVPPVFQPVSYAVFPFKNYALASDIDNDGLTDLEELLYGTVVDKPDTDEDGFPDGLEVENLYNPLGFRPVKLIDSGKVKYYINPTFNYSVFYPLLWPAQALDANNEQVIFASDTGEFIEILIEDNPLKLNVVDWYLGQSPGVLAGDLKTITTKDNLSGIISPDGLAVYLPFEDRIFIIYYNIGLKTEVNFMITFKMMVNSFKIGDLPEDLEETGGLLNEENFEEEIE